jgi:catechol 2,3-dioxygenase-like lactoylglutathione lyase family enzyme
VQVQHILETCLYVDDLTRAEQFYHDVLGLVVESRHEGRHVFFHCGQQMLLLFNPLESRAGDHFPPHGSFGAGHVAFAVHEAQLPVWVNRLTEHAVLIEKVIDWPSGGRSVYFRDPAGNSVELATPRIWDIPEEAFADRP